MGKWDKSPPSINKVEKVADYFGVSIDYLTGYTDDPQRTVALSEEKTRAISDDPGTTLVAFGEDDLKRMSDDELQAAAFRALQEIEKRKREK